jgi:hypothetical protein
MGRLSLFERIRIIKLYNDLEIGCKNKFKLISFLAHNKYGIEISDRGVINIVNKWKRSKKLADQIRHNRSKLMISNAGMLAINKALLTNPCLTLSKLKTDLNLIASKRTICRALLYHQYTAVIKVISRFGIQNI